MVNFPLLEKQLKKGTVPELELRGHINWDELWALVHALQNCKNTSLAKLKVLSIFPQVHNIRKLTKALGKFLSKLSGLVDLRLYAPELNSRGFLAFARAFPRMENLKKLDLSRHNKFDNDFVAAIVAALPAKLSFAIRRHDFALFPVKTPKLEHLNLEFNSIGSLGAVVLAGFLSKLCCLKVLNLGSNRLGDQGAVALSEGMHGMTALAELHLKGNHIGPDGAVALSGALRRMISLHELDFYWNPIRDRGSVAVAQALSGMKRLGHLDLGNCSIRHVGAVALAEALRSLSLSSPNAPVLDLGLNSIGDKGAMAFAATLKWPGKRNLLEIHLHNNGIGNQGAIALAHALHGNTSLRDLSLFGNFISGEGANAFIDAIMYHNYTLEDMCLYDKYVIDNDFNVKGDILNLLKPENRAKRKQKIMVGKAFCFVTTHFLNHYFCRTA